MDRARNVVETVSILINISQSQNGSKSSSEKHIEPIDFVAIRCAKFIVRITELIFEYSLDVHRSVDVQAHIAHCTCR